MNKVITMCLSAEKVKCIDNILVVVSYLSKQFLTPGENEIVNDCLSLYLILKQIYNICPSSLLHLKFYISGKRGHVSCLFLDKFKNPSNKWNRSYSVANILFLKVYLVVINKPKYGHKF